MTSEDMNNPLRTGSCSCGAIQFEVRGPVVGISECHCSKCRKESGTNSGMFIPVRAEQFRWISGEDHISDYDRCETCGSLAPYPTWNGKMYDVLAGLLDDYTGIQIAQHIFVGSKAHWDVIGDHAPQYQEDEGPPLVQL
ncbi:GFA family protein [Chloroflexi bacterium TSY]|nr:GFA family protein [Chloroflexi bacterium TSY]